MGLDPVKFGLVNGSNREAMFRNTEGDGEISFCGAIEMAGVITVKCTLMEDGQKQLGMVNGKSPIFIPGPVQPQFGPGRMLYFEVCALEILLNLMDDASRSISNKI